jgi:S1-C subfamily serine protease
MTAAPMSTRTLALVAALTAVIALPAAAIPTGQVIGMRRTQDTTRVGNALRVQVKLDSMKVVARVLDTIPMNDPQRRLLDGEVDRLSREILTEVGDSVNAPIEASVLIRTTRNERELREAIEAVVPRGWLGIHARGFHLLELRQRGMYIRYVEPPMIEVISPNSPADSAGLRAGDRIMAYNSQALVGRELNLTDMLQPGRQVVVHTLRNGQTQRFVLVAAEDDKAIREMRVNMLMGVLDESASRPAPPARAPMVSFGRGGTVFITTDSGGRRTVANGTSILTGIPMSVLPQASTGPTEIAGMQVQDLNSQLGATLGAAEGVFVFMANPGSPAHRWGFLGGDVITRVGTTRIRTVSELRRALSLRPGERVTVEIVREKQTKRIEVVGTAR